MMIINGKITTAINALNRGLQYGDGLFETLAVINKKPQLWCQHIRRLSYGCIRLGMRMPDEALLEQEVMALCEQSDERGVIKIILTRGQSARGYRGNNSICERIISLTDWPVVPTDRSKGIHLRWCKTRLGMNTALAGIKHLNRLEQVLARNEWQDDAVAEGLMEDQRGHVIEGTMSNLFIVKNKQLLTAKLDQCGVAGIIRELICNNTLDHGITVKQCRLFKKNVLEADEVFMCNSLMGIWPVIQIDDGQQTQAYTLGPVSTQVRLSLQKYLHA